MASSFVLLLKEKLSGRFLEGHFILLIHNFVSFEKYDSVHYHKAFFKQVQNYCHSLLFIGFLQK